METTRKDYLRMDVFLSMFRHNHNVTIKEEADQCDRQTWGILEYVNLVTGKRYWTMAPAKTLDLYRHPKGEAV